MLRVAVVAAALIGCGPSSSEVKLAKTATYRAPAQQIFDLALEATKETYKLEDVDPDMTRFATIRQYYDSEGGIESPGAGGMYHFADRSVGVVLRVEILEVDPTHVAIRITPDTVQVLEGSPKPRELTPDDPNLPPFVKGRVDALAVAIYQRAKSLAAPP
jgi:hypothetical protein